MFGICSLVLSSSKPYIDVQMGYAPTPPAAMDAVVTAIFETVRYITSYLWKKRATLAKFHGNIEALRKELEKLETRKNEIEEDVRLAEIENKLPTEQVKGWLRKVEEIVRDVQPMLEEAEAITVQYRNYCTGRSNCRRVCSRYQLSRCAAKKCTEVKQLIDLCNFRSIVVDRKSAIIAVERQQGPSLAGQRDAEEMIDRLMELLKDDENKRLAVWGMGGVGKTTLAINLNNKLQSSTLMQSIFDVVIWVTVSKDLDLETIQSQIGNRLNLELDEYETIEARAKILQKRLMKTKFLLILDDVWKQIDLDTLGVPQGQGDGQLNCNCKLLLTTRSLDVCREMMTNIEIKLNVLSEEAAWNLFAQNAGNVVELESINPVARAVARECCGLPLALKTAGKSMRNKTMIELWKNALSQLQRSVPHVKSIEEEVYLPLKLSYNSLPSKILQWCFLFCCLYPENYSIKTTELIQCWLADGLIDENQTLEEAFNYGIALTESLKDSCLLEQGGGTGTVRLHDVVRDVAIWISKESGFLSKSCMSLREIPYKLEKSFTRISFMNNKIARLPSQLQGCPELTVLFLQGNPLKKIPDHFFRGLRALRVLNLSKSLIDSLPHSLSQLGELRALVLRKCYSLEKLPPLGRLRKLQLLDLSGTGLRELPNETVKLTSLRELNLSHTYFLENIQAGTISGLSNLESLDVSFSAYKWNREGNAEEGRAAFSEIQTLEKLSFLNIRVEKDDSVFMATAWLRRLRKFHIRISPRSCDSNYLSTHIQNDHEKRVILRGVDLMGRGVEGLLCTATALDMVLCGGLICLSELALNKRLVGLQSLKTLNISRCECISSLVSGENIVGSFLPNLEHLTLSRLTRLGTIMEGMVPKRGCLGKLKTVKVVSCPKLRNLISFALLRQVKNLEEIKVSECRRMKCVILGKVSAAVFPKLRVIELKDLEKLRTICSRISNWPALETIDVSSCPMLDRLPFAACSNELSIREIKGEMEWWQNLIWGDDLIKFRLQQRFQPCTDSNMLIREDIWD